MSHVGLTKTRAKELKLRTGRAIERDTDIGSRAVVVVATVPREAEAILCITKAICGGVVFTFVVRRTRSTEVAFADGSRTVVVVLTVTGCTGSAETDLTCSTLAIERTGRAEAAQADLSTRTLAICAAVSRQTDLVDTKFARATLCVCGTGETLVVFTDLTARTVCVGYTVFAAIGDEVTFLIVGAICIFAAARATCTTVADLACSTLCISGTSYTLVLLADLAVFTVLVDGTVFTGQVCGIADLVGAVCIIAATRAALVVKADLARATLAIAAATSHTSSCGIADLAGVLAVHVICTSDAAELFTDTTVGTVAVGKTLAADVCGSVADLAVCTVSIFTTTITTAFGASVADLAA